MSWLNGLAGLTLLLWIAVAWEVMRGNRRLRRLVALASPPPARWPVVSLVLAARNEAHTVGAAVRTMLRLDYPYLELIAVNDRSEDATGTALEQLAVSDPRLRVEHLATLPAGWLGKNHALHFGAQQARGDWLLFTDADIHFQPDALRRAVAYAEAAGRDHLSVAPQLHERGALLGICVGTFSLLFAIFVRPWRIPDPCSAAHGGVGAFNLVRAATYRRVGGHAPIALRPDDDLMLGKLIKRHGGHSELLLGAGMLTVEWYASVGQMIAGLTKNAFAGVDYRVSMILGAILVHAVFWLWPVAGLFALSGVAAACNAGAVVLMLAVAVDNTRFTGGRWWHGLALPLGLVVLDWILWRSMWVTLRDDGITWRGTHYPLRALKANRL